MINRVLLFVFLILVIFVEIYFFNLLISINISFLVVCYYLLKKRTSDIIDFGFLFFFLKDFLSLNFVGPSLLAFVVGSYILSLFKKIAGEYYLGILNILLILILNSFFYDGFLNLTTFSNYLMILFFVIISIINNSGYLRPNKIQLG
jgi:hypothetical protein